MDQPCSFKGLKVEVQFDPRLLSPEEFFWLNITVPSFCPLMFREMFAVTGKSWKGLSGGTTNVAYDLAVFLMD